MIIVNSNVLDAIAVMFLWEGETDFHMSPYNVHVKVKRSTFKAAVLCFYLPRLHAGNDELNETLISSSQQLSFSCIKYFVSLFFRRDLQTVFYMK